MLVMFLRARCWQVGAFSVYIQQNKLQESQTGADVTVSDIRLAVERLWHFLLYAYYGLHLQRAKGHLNNIRKWLFVFEHIID